MKITERNEVLENPQFLQRGVGLLLFITNLNVYVIHLHSNYVDFASNSIIHHDHLLLRNMTCYFVGL